MSEPKRRLPASKNSLDHVYLESLQGAVAQRKPILSLVTKTGVRLDFWLDQKEAHELSEWLRGLADESEKPLAERH